jgi:WD40 repeat protein
MILVFEDEDNEGDSKIISFDAHEYPNGEILIICGKVSSCFKIYFIRNVNDKKPDITTKRIICNMEEKQLVNYVQIIDNGTKLLTCCNDSNIRIYDLESLDIVITYSAINCVNHAEIGNNMVAAVGDYEKIILFDRNSTNVIMNLTGHNDFGFAVRFKDDYNVGSGNQDHTCKLWDIRKGECYKTIYGYFEAIGDIAFIDSDQLILAENMDFLHIYDCKNDTIQTIEYFAYSSGFCYKRGMIYQGLFEHSNFGIMVYERIRNNVFSLNNIIY